TQTLVNFGAEVIKVEPPEGDVMRRARPVRGNGISVIWAQVNCGKTCISLDLDQAEGRTIARDLALSADVVVENFRPGVMARLGLGPDDLRADKPELIYCSISGYGQHGPAARRRAYAPIIHAEMGLLDLGAEPRGLEPQPEPVSHADFAVGSQAATAICAALFGRTQTGRGTHLDVSMAETMLSMMEWTAIEANGGMQGEIPTFWPAKAFIVRTGDGNYAQLPGNPATTFPAFVRNMGRPELLEDPRFANQRARFEHVAEMTEVIREWAATFPDRDALEAAMEPMKLPVGAIKRLADIADEPWAVERGAFTTVSDRCGGSLRLPFSPVRASDYAVGVHGEPARQGEANDGVLASVLGLDRGTIDRLREAGVVVEPTDGAR
ncbi:MAG: CoA transferase, partial [Acidimicrobiia bacterium]|nr:CoA transferase [Acidimicrobiia bacterium]